MSKCPADHGTPRRDWMGGHPTARALAPWCLTATVTLAALRRSWARIPERMGQGLSGALWFPMLLLLLTALVPILLPLAMLRLFLRKRLGASPIPTPWKAILERLVPWYRRMSAKRKREFERDVLLFVLEHDFDAAGGAEITDELRVLAAASAVLMTFGQGDSRPLFVHSVVFHPGLIERPWDPIYKITKAAGQYLPFRAVELSIPAFLEGVKKDDDGYHPGLHEFAHSLDAGDFRLDGVPWGMPSHRVAEWIGLMRDEMDRARNGRGFLDRDASTSEAQFLAFCVEAFFERPAQVQKANPRLYEILDECFGGR